MNLTFGGWDTAFAGDGVLAAAMLHRILRHSIILSYNRGSYRLKDKRKVGLLPLRPKPLGTPTAIGGSYL